PNHRPSPQPTHPHPPGARNAEARTACSVLVLRGFFHCLSHDLARIVWRHLCRSPSAKEEEEEDEEKDEKRGKKKADTEKGHKKKSAVRLALDGGEAASWWWRTFVASTDSASAYLRRPGRCSTVAAALLQNCSPCVKNRPRKARTDKTTTSRLCAGQLLLLAPKLETRVARAERRGVRIEHPESTEYLQQSQSRIHIQKAPPTLLSCPSRSPKPGAARPTCTHTPLPFPRRDGVRRAAASFHPLARSLAARQTGEED
ncbi:hypothetical protein MAPG_03130, partial [Magnaporthiopsis poae ATCC 64411]|uniref:Uncharacterized protein n=1 Tax=Magnaporthiopsis poae (strain ATCC 64411 / 73-15) TaxID=644358 RepID=A0A0C4DT71_MAGP6